MDLLDLKTRAKLERFSCGAHLTYLAKPIDLDSSRSLLLRCGWLRVERNKSLVGSSADSAAKVEKRRGKRRNGSLFECAQAA